MKASRRKKGPNLFVISIFVVLALGIVAIVLSRGGGTPSEPVTADVTVTGDTLPQYSGEGDDPAVGEAIPRVRGEDLDGAPMTIDTDGPQVLIFLAHWCPHCQDEVRELVAWLEDNELPSGVDYVTVSTLVNQTRGNFPPKAWLEREDWPFPVLVDDANSTVATSFGLASTPYWVFVDEDGNVAARRSGVLPPQALSRIAEALGS